MSLSVQNSLWTLRTSTIWACVTPLPEIHSAVEQHNTLFWPEESHPQRWDRVESNIVIDEKQYVVHFLNVCRRNLSISKWTSKGIGYEVNRKKKILPETRKQKNQFLKALLFGITSKKHIANTKARKFWRSKAEKHLGYYTSGLIIRLWTLRRCEGVTGTQMH